VAQGSLNWVEYGLLYGYKGQRSVTAPTEIISKERFTLLYSLKKNSIKKSSGVTA